MPSAPNTKPLLRGVSHSVAAGFAALAWLALARIATSNAAQAAANIYGASLFILFATSAVYHRVHWPPRVRRRIAQLDLSAIFLLVAGTITPFCLLLDSFHATLMLCIAWGGALFGILNALLRKNTPKVASAISYVALGWTLVLILPAIGGTLGAQAVEFLVAGGIVYSLGAAVYATQRPNPFPRVFGYHEVFHAMVIAAAVLHFEAAIQAIRTLG